MSFGSPTPDRGRRQRPELGRQPGLRREGLRSELAQIPSLRDLQFVQSLDYPTVDVRGGPRAGRPERRDGGGRGPLAGRGHLVEPLRRARSTGPIPKTGIGYQVQVEIPPYQMNSAEEVGMVPVKRHGDRASCCSATWPGVQRGHDAGRVRPLQHEAAGEPDGQHRGRGPGPGGRPRRPAPSRRPASRRAGVTVDVRGQVVPMQQMFRRPGASAWAWRWSSSSCC